MQFQSSFTKGLNYTSRFFNVKSDNFNKIMVDSGTDSDPELRINNLIQKIGSPVSATFDGMLNFTYAENKGILVSRTIYPSNTNALVIEEWQVKNQSDKAVKMSVSATRQVKYTDEEIVVIRTCTGMEPVSVAAGEKLSFIVSIQGKGIHAQDKVPDVAAEHEARVNLAKLAWQGPGRLETPDAALDLAFALQKFHILECPAETWKGIITHNGSLRYSPGIWANDPVEYSSPVFPFFGNDQLNNASLNMYRIWMDYCKEKGIRPFPGSFEYASLKLVQQQRGDDAMVLYGLSKFLLFLGDPKAAAEMWPLIEFSAQSVQGHLTKEGIIASETDEMEGRYPTGDANLSTSSLAYAGYRQAAHLAHDLGKKSVEIDFNNVPMHCVRRSRSTSVQKWKAIKHIGILKKTPPYAAGYYCRSPWASMKGRREPLPLCFPINSGPAVWRVQISWQNRPGQRNGHAKLTMLSGYCSKPATPMKRSI
jgi:hypothetical protein